MNLRVQMFGLAKASLKEMDGLPWNVSRALDAVQVLGELSH